MNIHKDFNKDRYLYALVDKDGKVINAKNGGGKFYQTRKMAEKRIDIVSKFCYRPAAHIVKFKLELVEDEQS